MADSLPKVTEVDWRRVLPWIHLIRAFKIAISIRNLILGAIAVVALWGGNQLITCLPFGQFDNGQDRWDTSFQQSGVSGIVTPLTQTTTLLEEPQQFLTEAVSHGTVVFEPVAALVEPAAVLFNADASPNRWNALADAWTRLLWTLCVFAFVGGAITRISAVQFARDERVGLLAALRFSGSKFLSYMTAPLLPMFGIGVLWAICAVGGWLGRIPTVGGILVGVLWCIALLCGFLMAVMLLGLAVGWPLMYAAIGVEGSDGFDGLARSYSYVFDRPWYYLWSLLVMAIHGSVVLFFAWLFACLTSYLGAWGVAAGMGLERVDALLLAAPKVLGGENLLAQINQFTTPPGAVIVAAWLLFVTVLLAGLVQSYFWTAMTIVYFLLRKSDDGVDLRQVYYEETEDDFAPVATEAAIETSEADKPTNKPDGNTTETNTDATTKPAGEPPSSGEDSDAEAGQET